MPGRIWGVQIERQTAGSVLILTISGRLGHQTAPALREVFNGFGERWEPAAVDLGRVDYISGPALAALQAAVAAHHGAVVLFGVTEPVRIAFELAGVLADFAIEPTLDAALARLHRSSERH